MIVLSFLERNPNGVGVAIESERCRAHQHKASVSRYRLCPKGQMGMAL